MHARALTDIFEKGDGLIADICPCPYITLYHVYPRDFCAVMLSTSVHTGLIRSCI